MRHLTKAERTAAAAVLGAAAGVTVTGVRLLGRYTRYMTQKAAAFFDKEEQSLDGAQGEKLAWPEEAVWDQDQNTSAKGEER